MSKEEHLSYLKQLESQKEINKDSLCIPKKEGAFWFGEYHTFNEYVSLYRKECIKEGWANE
jgi:hypothetical protein